MKKGFTLLELIIVIIVIGILAGLALPQYIRVAERARSAEGSNLLGMLRSAEIRYYSEKSKWTTTLTHLDVEYTTPKYFTTVTVGTSDSDVANVTRNSTDRPAGYEAYTLTIDKGGTITCSSGATACPAIGR